MNKQVAQHTPGPFSVVVGKQYCFHDGNRVAIVKLHNAEGDDPMEETVAEVWPTSGSDTDIADGYLFAAAHEMLEALRALDYAYGVADFSVQEKCRREAWAKARAAIAKATEGKL